MYAHDDVFLKGAPSTLTAAARWRSQAETVTLQAGIHLKQDTEPLQININCRISSSLGLSYQKNVIATSCSPSWHYGIGRTNLGSEQSHSISI
jgi:hypothetical protein